MRLAAAVGFLRRVLVGVKQEADAAVKARLHVFDTCGNNNDDAESFNANDAGDKREAHRWACWGRTAAAAETLRWVSRQEGAEPQSPHPDWLTCPSALPAPPVSPERRSIQSNVTEAAESRR